MLLIYFGKITVDKGGKSHHIETMPTTLERPKSKQRLTVLENYDVAADAKKRISLRNARTKYFHVQALSNGAICWNHACWCRRRPFPPAP